MEYTFDELNNYTKKQLKVILQYEEKSFPKKATKAQLIDLVLQETMFEDDPPASVRIKRIRQSQE